MISTSLTHRIHLDTNIQLEDLRDSEGQEPCNELWPQRADNLATKQTNKVAISDE